LTFDTFVFYMISSNINFSFTNNYLISQTNKPVANALLFYDIFNLNSCIFQNLGTKSAMILSTSSNLAIFKSSFLLTSNTAESKNNQTTINIYFIDVAINSSTLIIENCIFQNQGVGNYIFINYAFNVNIRSSTFMIFEGISFKNLRIIQEINSSLFTRAIFIQNFNNFSVENCSINGFKSSFGGAIAIFNEETGKIATSIFRNCSFSHNTAFLGGVFFVRGDLNLSIILSLFTNNKAILYKPNSQIDNQIYDSGKGGVLVADCEIYADNCLIFLNFSSFINNNAEAFGPVAILKN